MTIISTIFWLIVVLVILVVVHELGHFIAARGFGVRVTEFMIGLPGPNIGFEHNGTKFGITCIPLGGYNRITGMESGPEDPNLETVLAYVYRQGKADVQHTALACGLSEEDAETALIILDGWGSINAPGRSNKSDFYMAPKTAEFSLGEPREVADSKALIDSERKLTYRGLKFWKRLVVLFAGPLMNVLLAMLLFIAIFCGVGVSVADTTISGVTEDGPAALAGLQEGDTIVSIDGQDTPDWSTLSTVISGFSSGEQVEITFTRDGITQSTSVQVGQNESGSAYLGIYAGSHQERFSVGEALVVSWDYLVVTVQAYASLFNPATAADTLSQSSSIVGIGVMAQQAASTSLISLLYIIAVVSLSLGVVNLLPLPPLDGGKIVVEIIQKILGRDISARVINGITVVVMIALLILFVFLFQQDIVRFFLGG